MEPLSITASIIAVAGAAATASKCAQALYKVSRKAGAVREEVEFFASYIDTFGSIVKTAHNSIRNHYIEHRQSATLHHLDRQETLKELAWQSDHLMRRLQGLKPDLKDRNADFGLLGTFRWVIKRYEREELCVWLERVKMSFVLIMYEVMYEALQQRSFSRDPLPQGLFDLRREIRKHKKVMKRHIETMHIWRDRQDSFGDDRSHSLVLNRLEESVIDVGQSMISQSASNSSSTESATSGGRLRDDTSDFAVRDIDRPRSSSLQRPLPQLSPPQRPNPAVHPPAAPPDREQTLRRALTFPSTPDDPPEHWNEDDYIAVHPSDNVLHLDADLNSEAITGYIDLNSNSTVAKLNQEFSRNVISEQQAASLNLHVEYYIEDEEGMEIDFGASDSNGRQPIMGEVAFAWKKGQESKSRPLKITCLVCKYLPSPLIFGKPFLERRRHYWEE